MSEKVLKIGLFHPSLNICGGAEHVAITMIDSSKKCGHTVIALVDKKIDQSMIRNMFGKKSPPIQKLFCLVCLFHGSVFMQMFFNLLY